jgi:hypothetical protein
MQIRPDALAAALVARPARTDLDPRRRDPAGDSKPVTLARRAARAAGLSRAAGLPGRSQLQADALIAETARCRCSPQRLIELRSPTSPRRSWAPALAAILATLDDSTRLLVSSVRLDRAVTETAWFVTSMPRIGGGRRGRRTCRSCPPGSASGWPPAASGRCRHLAHAGRTRRRQPAGRPPGDAQARPAFPEGLLPAEDRCARWCSNVARYDAFGHGAGHAGRRRRPHAARPRRPARRGRCRTAGPVGADRGRSQPAAALPGRATRAARPPP